MEKKEATLADLELAHHQFLLVVDLADQIKKLAEDLDKMLPTLARGEMGHFMLVRQGHWSAGVAEMLGDVLNDTDAVPDDYEKWDTVFAAMKLRNWKDDPIYAPGAPNPSFSRGQPEKSHE